MLLFRYPDATRIACSATIDSRNTHIAGISSKGYGNTGCSCSCGNGRS